MATTIPEVSGVDHIRSALLIDLTIDTTTYYISSSWKSLSYGGNNYTELGAFLQLGQVQEDLKTTNGDIAIVLTGVPDTYIPLVLNTKVKGGDVKVYRAFFDDNYTVSNVYQRFSGVITNFAIEENVDILEGDTTQTIQVSCASINTILETKLAGQRTNPADRKKYYPTDNTFGRVPDLMGVQYDFGREYRPGSGGYTGGGGGRAGLNPLLGGINVQIR